MIKIRRVYFDRDIEKIKMLYEKSFEVNKGILDHFYFGFREYINFCVKQNYAYMAIFNECECGYIMAYKKPDMMFGEELYIELLVVLPEYQRKGIGTKLLEKVKAQAQKEGIKELALRTGCYMGA